MRSRLNFIMISEVGSKLNFIMIREADILYNDKSTI
jgi:hypothetical protein